MYIYTVIDTVYTCIHIYINTIPLVQTCAEQNKKSLEPCSSRGSSLWYGKSPHFSIGITETLIHGPFLPATCVGLQQ